MERILCLTLLLLLLVASLCGAQDNRAVPIKVRGDHNFAPFEYLDENGAARGFDLDILQAVAEVMNLRVELSLGPWEEVRQDLENKRIDALAGMRYSHERDLLLDFSAPYLINTSAIFVRAGSDISSLADLRGREVIVQRGDIMHDFVRATHLSSHLVLVDSQSEALNLLASGRHDAALCSRLRGLYLIHRLGLDTLVAVGPELEAGPYGFAVAEGNVELLARLDEGLRILKATGRYDEIYQRWFGLYEKEADFAEILRHAAWVFVPLLLLALAAFAWSWTLRRQVALKTRELGEQMVERQRAETQLAAQSKFRQFVETSPVPMAIVDREQRILYVNDKFTELFGYTLDELADLARWWALACPDPHRRQQAIDAWEAWSAPGGSPATGDLVFEIDVVCRDGAVCHVSCRHSSIDERHFIVFNDMTERQQAEKTLKARMRVEAMVSAISTRFVNLASADVDRALKVIGEKIGVDRSYVFRFSADGQTMSNTHEWCAPGIEPHRQRLQDLPREDFAWLLRKLEGGRVFNCPSVAHLGPEAQSEKREWQLEGIQSLMIVPMLQKGEMVGFVGFDSVRGEREWPPEIPFLLRLVGESFANALERRRGEEALRAAHRRLQDIIEFLPDATFVIDREGRVVAWNRAVEEMTGVPKEQMVGRGDHAYALPFYGERRPMLLDQVRDVEVPAQEEPGTGSRERKSLVAEQYLPALNDGRGAYAWAKASPLFDREGRLTGVIESIRDITERREAQEKLEASHREMEAFVYTVSHDLRTPLTPIIGYADLLRQQYRDRLDGQALECLAEISASGSKMLQLMEDLLALARIGRLEAPAEPVDTDAVVRKVLEGLASRIIAADALIELQALPPLRVPDTLLFQIFSNLIGNAMNYAGREGSPIEVGGKRSGDLVSFFVRDHGPGISAAERERIFEVFYRGTAGRNCSGTGIGLATVEKIARLYGGRARVEETPGGGATFWVEMREADAVAPGADRGGSSLPAGGQ